jgi:Ca2+-binding EF-hand superfamily protein
MSEGVQSVLARIKEFGQSRGLDFEGELLAYDHKRKGVISTVSLHRWLGGLGISLSNHNIRTLILAYQKDDVIDVLRLIQDLQQSQTFTQTITSRPANCDAELAELARELAARHQALRDVLAPYDRRNVGKVSPGNFIRAFGATPVTQALTTGYAIGGEVDYLRMESDLRPVCRALRNATPVIPEPTPGFTALAILMKAHDVDARRVFSQADPLNTGKIPRLQFESLLSFFDPKLSPSTIGQIAVPFLDEGGRLANYFLFLAALDQFVPPRPKTPTTERPEQVSKTLDPNYILEQARLAIEDRRIDLDQHFSALEREGTGDTVPFARFARVILGMRLALQEYEIKAIASLFPGDFGTVSWRDFVAAVRRPVTSREVVPTEVVSRLRAFLAGSYASLASSARRFDRENSGVISVPQFTSALQFLKFDFSPQDLAALRSAYPGPARGTIDWRTLCTDVDKPADTSTTDDEAPALGHSDPSSLEPKIAALVSRVWAAAGFDHVDPLVELRALDRLRNGRVPQAAFAGFINRVPARLELPDIRILTAHYRISGSSEVNYIAFCQDAKALEAAPPAQPDVTPTVTTRTFDLEAIPMTVREFIRRFKTFCAQQRIVPGDIFLAYDAWRNGLIPIFNVQACFNNVDFPLLRGEVEELVAVFRDPRKRDLFNYLNFTRAVSQEDVTSPEVRAQLAPTPISPDLDRTAATAALQIREKLLARHRRIEMAFKDVTTPTIGAPEFQKRLQAMDLVLLAAQVNALLRKYRVNLGDAIDWRAFVSDVQNSKTVGVI